MHCEVPIAQVLSAKDSVPDLLLPALEVDLHARVDDAPDGHHGSVGEPLLPPASVQNDDIAQSIQPDVALIFAGLKELVEVTKPILAKPQRSFAPCRRGASPGDIASAVAVP